MNYRLHPLYRLAREVGGQEIDWDNPKLARLQYEMRVDYVEQMLTQDLIGTVVVDVDESVDWSNTLADIHGQPELASDYELALGQGRH